MILHCIAFLFINFDNMFCYSFGSSFFFFYSWVSRLIHLTKSELQPLANMNNEGVNEARSAYYKTVEAQ